jgi:hypothetical protein
LEKEYDHCLGGRKGMMAVQGFGRPVVQKDCSINENFFSGSSIKNSTPDTADMSLNPENRQDGNNNRESIS